MIIEYSGVLLEDVSIIQVHCIGTGNFSGKLGVWMTPRVAVSVPPHIVVDAIAVAAPDGDAFAVWSDELDHPKNADDDDNDDDDSIVRSAPAVDTTASMQLSHTNGIIDNGLDINSVERVFASNSRV